VLVSGSQMPIINLLDKALASAESRFEPRSEKGLCPKMPFFYAKPAAATPALGGKPLHLIFPSKFSQKHYPWADT